MPKKSSKKRKRVARKQKKPAKKRKSTIIYVTGEENAKGVEPEGLVTFLHFQEDFVQLLLAWEVLAVAAFYLKAFNRSLKIRVTELQDQLDYRDRKAGIVHESVVASHFSQLIALEKPLPKYCLACPEERHKLGDQRDRHNFLHDLVNVQRVLFVQRLQVFEKYLLKNCFF